MAIDRDEFTEQSRATWDKMAPGWEERRPWFQEITGTVNAWLADKVDARPGDTVLDVAAGTGDLGMDLAARVGDQGGVISTDFAPEMVEAARRVGAERGVENVEYRVMNAERMDIDDDSVDGVVCRWGYMLMADPATALAETRRVLRDGGRLAFAVWTTPDRNPWAAIPAMILVQRGHLPPPEPGMPGILALGDPDRVRELVTGAGFDEPEIEEITFDFRYDDFDDIWDTLMRLAGPLAQAISGLDDAERQATREAIEEGLARFRNDDGSFQAPASTWGVLAS